jgi:hypothetical protein
MTMSSVSELLRDKLLQIVQGAAFMFVDDDAAPLPASAAGVQVKLGFTGAQQGAFWLAMSVEDSNRLAACMLGRPLDDTMGTDTAAPAEFLNILGNWVLDALWGDEFDYHVGIPTVEAVQLEQCVAWSIPADQRAIVQTDAGCTLVCGVTWGDDL